MKTFIFYGCMLSVISWAHAQSMSEPMSQKIFLKDFELSKAIDSVVEYDYRLLKNGELKAITAPSTLIFDSTGRLSKVTNNHTVRRCTYTNKRLTSIYQLDKDTGVEKIMYQLDGKIGKDGNELFYYNKNHRLDSIISNDIMTTEVTKYRYDKNNDISEKEIIVTGKLSGSIVRNVVGLYYMAKLYATFDLISGDMSYLKTNKGFIIRKDKELVSSELKKSRELLASTKKVAMRVENPFDYFKMSYDGWIVKKTFINDNHLDWTSRAELIGENLTNPLRYVHTRVIYYSNGKVKGTQLPDNTWLLSLPDKLNKI